MAVELTPAPFAVQRQLDSSLEAILGNAVILKVRFHYWGLSRKLDSALVQVNGDKSMMAFSKRLLDCDEYRAIANVESQCKRYLDETCLPGPFGLGVRIVPITLLDLVDARLAVWAAEHEVAVRAFLEVYRERASDARLRLGDAWNPADYPPVERVAARFGFERSYLSLGTPTTPNAALNEREQAKARAEWEATIQEWTAVLRAAMQELVDHLADVLAPAPDGSRKRITSAFAKPLQEFMASFGERNLAGDYELAALVERAQNLLKGVNADVLKDAPTFRETFRTQLGAVKTQLDRLVEAQPRRGVSFDLDL